MPVHTREHLIAVPPSLDNTRQRFAGLAWLTAIYTYLLVVFGGIVRITGSGLGCGDDWPLCNGQIFPPWDLATWIEWSHRLLAAVLVIPLGIVVWSAIKNRDRPGFGGRGGALRPALWAVVLLVIQIALGAITVRLDLPASVTSVHFINSLLLVAVLVVASIRARGPGVGPEDPFSIRRVSRSATAALVLGFVVITFGAFTANLGIEGAQTAPSTAAWACQGFPLCNGQLMPKGDAAGFVHTHWTHRMLAYLFFFHLIGATASVFKRGASVRVRRAALTSLTLAVMQITVAALLVLHNLPSSMRVLHLVVGAALWISLVVWATGARQDASRLDQEVG